MLGMDVSKKKFHVVLVGAAGRSHQHEFANCAAGFAQLAAWLQRQDAAGVHACLEATGSYGEELARFLHQAGHRVSVVHPRPIRAFAASEMARNKTDPLDAGRIARFCQAQRLRANGKQPMVIVGAAMRKLLYLAYGILKSGVPFNPNYSSHYPLISQDRI